MGLVIDPRLMPETLIGPEDLASGSCRRVNAFATLGRSNYVPTYLSSERDCMLYEAMGRCLGCISSEDNDFVRRAPFAIDM